MKFRTFSTTSTSFPRVQCFYGQAHRLVDAWKWELWLTRYDRRSDILFPKTIVFLGNENMRRIPLLPTFVVTDTRWIGIFWENGGVVIQPPGDPFRTTDFCSRSVCFSKPWFIQNLTSSGLHNRPQWKITSIIIIVSTVPNNTVPFVRPNNTCFYFCKVTGSKLEHIRWTIGKTRFINILQWLIDDFWCAT